MAANPTWALPALVAIMWLGPPALGQAVGSEDEVEPTRESSSPFDAYREGDYDVAVQGFRERANRRPKDAVRQLNLGSALHQTSEYAEAESALQRAADTADQSLRAAALYNLGNNSYHQGRLEEAVEHYRQALDLKPDDEDTKYNLEFVQQEMERRREQSQNRQSSPQEPQDENQDQREQGGQQDSDSSDGDQESEAQPQNGEDSPGGEERDSDEDGLSDQQERRAENPTDPNNPDSDGDGRSDGEEDRNRNGRVDEGETNPNVPDPSGDGDQGPQEQQQGQQPQPGEGRPNTASMSPEDAARLLASLEDRRPPGARGKKVAETTKRSEKDW